jgi:quercetin dioxygenase-like cupin family protein
LHDVQVEPRTLAAAPGNFRKRQKLRIPSTLRHQKAILIWEELCRHL